jgi:hypothetical protein
MEGIYLTDEAKKGIQDKITDLEKSRKFWAGRKNIKLIFKELKCNNL